MGQWESAVALRPHPLLFHPALLPAVTHGKEVVLGKAGDSVELPCKGSQKGNVPFSWKFTNQIKVLGNQNSYLIIGKISLPQSRVEANRPPPSKLCDHKRLVLMVTQWHLSGISLL
jgi:hypothetical protein